MLRIRIRLASVERIGRAPGDVRAIVLTHAHPDHLGGSERLRASHGISARMLEAEAPHARGELIVQVRELQIIRAAWRPRVLLWSMRILRAGGARVERLTQVAPFAAGSGPLDLPGRPVPVPTRATPPVTAPSTCPNAACSSPATP